jgi:hypothetical protein
VGSIPDVRSKSWPLVRNDRKMMRKSGKLSGKAVTGNGILSNPRPFLRKPPKGGYHAGVELVEFQEAFFVQP